MSESDVPGGLESLEILIRLKEGAYTQRIQEPIDEKK